MESEQGIEIFRYVLSTTRPRRYVVESSKILRAFSFACSETRGSTHSLACTNTAKAFDGYDLLFRVAL